MNYSIFNMSQPSGRRLKIASFYQQEKIPLSTPVLVSFSTTASAVFYFSSTTPGVMCRLIRDSIGRSVPAT
jgi:hypothetical protein